MIIAYINQKRLQAHQIDSSTISLLDEALWIDLVYPTKEDEALIERYLELDIPTREEMSEIEVSSRLYKHKDALFMTANMIAQSASLTPQQDPVTFILTPQKLITIRYIEPQAFQLFISQLQKFETDYSQASVLLIGLLEAAIDRFADILEMLSHRLETFSQTIFHPLQPEDHRLDYQLIIQNIGVNADLNTKARECLVSFSRLILFLGQSASTQLAKDEHTRLGVLSKDILSLSDHSNFISNKTNFLLDATLGMINIEQNAIIKIFSVAAVIFLPPTLIASIYGMNFSFMPELNFKWGYSMALGLMVISAILPYFYFKRKKWL